jgi:hypothetical protein
VILGIKLFRKERRGVVPYLAETQSVPRDFLRIPYEEAKGFLSS